MTVTKKAYVLDTVYIILKVNPENMATGTLLGSAIGAFPSLDAAMNHLSTEYGLTLEDSTDVDDTTNATKFYCRVKDYIYTIVESEIRSK